MRIILIYLLFGMLILSQIGCSDDNNSGPDEPIVWYQYFAFVDEEGNDFFENNADYSTESVGFTFNNNMGNFEEITQLENGLYVFGLPGPVFSDHEMILIYGNGDKDTLSIQWSPQIESPHRNIKELNIEFFYNEVKIDQWDFISNTDLFYEIEHRNRISSAHPTATNPIYIEIVKKPNPEEFD